MESAQDPTLEPEALDRGTLRSLASRIAEKARGDDGFMIAFRGSGRHDILGFCFLVALDDRYAWVDGITRGLGERFTCCSTYAGHLGYLEAIKLYIDQSARLMDMPKEKLLRELAQKNSAKSLWRFIGYLDGKGECEGDNRLPWRALWGRLVELARPELVEALPDPHIKRTLIMRLRHCATEGQVILER